MSKKIQEEEKKSSKFDWLDIIADLIEMVVDIITEIID